MEDIFIKTWPDPDSAHPAYDEKTVELVRSWLAGEKPLLPKSAMATPFLKGPVWYSEEVPLQSEMGVHTMERKKCWARAPYVGRAFVYVWDVAVDELGRCITGPARMLYLDDRLGA